MKFSGVITIDNSDVDAKGQRWRSHKSKQILPQFGRWMCKANFVIPGDTVVRHNNKMMSIMHGL